MPKHTPTHRATPTRRQALLALLGTALLPACGGGTDVAGVSSGGTGSFTSGTITGLGSVIVNGIRYDDDKAAISINGLPGSPADLKLGMVVRIQGSAITAATTTSLATAEANSLSCSSEWKGVVGAIDPAARTLTLLGLKVYVVGTTIFEGGTFGALDGEAVEVYGFSFTDPASGDLALRATRVEVKDQALGSYRLSGVVSHLSSAQQTFQLGNTTINYASSSGTTGLQNGQLVRVDLQIATNASGHWVATAVRAENTSSELEDDHEAEIEGTVTSTITAEKAFSVSGMPVDASRMSNLPSLSLGMRVDVKGRFLNGTVIATEVEVEDDEDIESQEFEFHGAISALTSNTFVVRGYTLHYNGTTRFELSGTTLTDGLLVEVKAKLQPNGDLLATQVELDD